MTDRGEQRRAGIAERVRAGRVHAPVGIEGNELVSEWYVCACGCMRWGMRQKDENEREAGPAGRVRVRVRASRDGL